MLIDVFRTVMMAFQSDTALINLRRLQAKPKVQTDVLDELLSAYMARNISTERKMQEAMDRILQACDNYDLKLSTKKTEVVYQPAPRKPYS